MGTGPEWMDGEPGPGLSQGKRGDQGATVEDPPSQGHVRSWHFDSPQRCLRFCTLSAFLVSPSPGSRVQEAKGVGTRSYTEGLKL